MKWTSVNWLVRWSFIISALNGGKLHKHDRSTCLPSLPDGSSRPEVIKEEEELIKEEEELIKEQEEELIKEQEEELGVLSSQLPVTTRVKTTASTRDLSRWQEGC